MPLQAANPVASAPPPGRPALAACHTANPPLAVLAGTLREPLVPMIGFAQLLLEPNSPLEGRIYANEILAGSRKLLALLDCCMALLAGRSAPDASPAELAAAEDVVAALHSLLIPPAQNTTNDCGAAQRRVA